MKSMIHIPFSPDSVPKSPMNNCISLQDDNCPSVGNNPTIGNKPIGEGSVSARGKRSMGSKSLKVLLRKSQAVEVGSLQI
ncbi:hypothetical protein ACSBR1_003172 [Camellia fascicularis]